MKENDKTATTAKRPPKCPSALAAVPSDTHKAAANEKRPQEKSPAEEKQSERGKKATWRVTPSYGESLLLAGQALAAGGNDPWRLALETRDMLLWRRQTEPGAEKGGGSTTRQTKRPVTWYVKS